MFASFGKTFPCRIDGISDLCYNAFCISAICLLGVGTNMLNAGEGGAVIQVAGETDAEVLSFRTDALLFTDRTYRLHQVPDLLDGRRFLMSSIDRTALNVVQGGELTVLTPVPIEGATSEAALLEQQGFIKQDLNPFQLFGDQERNSVLTYTKSVETGESYSWGKWVVVLGFEEARSAFDRAMADRDRPYHVYPSDIPNTGILFVDQEKDGRSGHAGITVTECKNGDVLAFYQNGANDESNWMGHGSGGWSEYRRSTDGGMTWGEPVVFDYSREQWYGDDVFSAIVYSLITAPDGTLVATVLRYRNERWVKAKAPVYFLSHDHGDSWKGPFSFDENSTVEDISMTMNTSFLRDGEVFIVFRGGSSNMAPGGPHTLWVSGDNGRSFHRRSVLPFNDADYYWAAGTLDNGEIIVYTYNAHQLSGDARRHAERNIPYTISKDGGRTWSEPRTAYFAKGIRNMQLSEKLGAFYFMHGRSGSYRPEGELEAGDPGPGNFVLYYSEDGINWDEGVLLMSRRQTAGGGDCYSANAIIGKYDTEMPQRLLIQSDISYRGSRTNMHHWWVSVEPLDFSVKRR